MRRALQHPGTLAFRARAQMLAASYLCPRSGVALGRDVGTNKASRGLQDLRPNLEAPLYAFVPVNGAETARKGQCREHLDSTGDRSTLLRVHAGVVVMSEMGLGGGCARSVQSSDKRRRWLRRPLGPGDLK